MTAPQSSEETKNNSEHKIGVLNLLAIVLSIYVLGALLVDSVMELPPETSRLLNYFDTLICIFFFFEFCVRFNRAGNKAKFMQWAGLT